MRPGEGTKRVRMLGVDAALDRRALDAHVLLRDRQRRAGGDLDLLVDEIDAGDHLGHGMLDLDAGVHLDEIEPPVLVEELDRADAEIAELGHRARDDAADLLALLRVERGARGLPPRPSDAGAAASSRARRDGSRALAVAEHLNFDVPRLLQIFFQIDRVVAERRLGLALGGGDGLDQIRPALARDLHAAPAAARRRLHQHGIADFAGDSQRLRLVADGALGAGHAGDAEPLGGALGLDLVAHDADVLGLRPDEGDAVLVEDLGEAGVLGRESRSPDAPRRRR